MKLNLSFLTGTASLAMLISGAFADSAVTDPVGYITVAVNGNASGYTYSAIAPTLANKIEYAGTVATATATTITFTGTPFTAGAFTTGYWVEITNGSGEGYWTNITGNTTSAITVADDMSSLITGGTSTIKIRQHVTVGQFFGATNTAGLKPGDDAGIADEVFFIDAGGATFTEVFYDGTGWSDQDFAPAANKVIEPGQGLLVARKATTPTSFVFTGHVKTGKSVTSILKGNNVVAIPEAVGVSFDLSNLVNATPATSLTSGADGGLADEVFIFDTAGVGHSFFHDDQWYDENFAPAGTSILKEGTSAYIVRKQVAAVNWIAPATVIAP